MANKRVFGRLIDFMWNLTWWGELYMKLDELSRKPYAADSPFKHQFSEAVERVKSLSNELAHELKGDSSIEKGNNTPKLCWIDAEPPRQNDLFKLLWMIIFLIDEIDTMKMRRFPELSETYRCIFKRFLFEVKAEYRQRGEIPIPQDQLQEYYTLFISIAEWLDKHIGLHKSITKKGTSVYKFLIEIQELEVIPNYFILPMLSYLIYKTLDSLQGAMESEDKKYAAKKRLPRPAHDTHPAAEKGELYKWMQGFPLHKDFYPMPLTVLRQGFVNASENEHEFTSVTDLPPMFGPV